jgi:hypothetical protein
MRRVHAASRVACAAECRSGVPRSPPLRARAPSAPQFVVDLWYRSLTPDAAFPEEVRRLVCALLGACAARVARVNLGALLVRDTCDVLAEQLELYRRVRDRRVAQRERARVLSLRCCVSLKRACPFCALSQNSIGEDTLGRLSPEARDRALAAEMAADGDLLSAAAGGEAEQAVLRGLMRAVCALVLPRPERDAPLLRTLAAELLAGYVFRPLMGFAAPFWVNKLLLAGLNAQPQPQTTTPSAGACARGRAMPHACEKHKNLLLSGAVSQQHGKASTLRRAPTFFCELRS